MPVPVPLPSLLPPEMQARVRVQMQMQMQLHLQSPPTPPRRPQYPPTPDAYNDNIGPMSPATPSGNQVALAPALPPAAAVNLLNNLLVFYQHERNWVQRTRASIELALVQGPLVVVPKIGSPLQLPADSSSADSGDMSGSTLTDDPTPSDEERDMDIVKKEEDADDDMQLRADAGPLTLRATKRARAPASRWLKRKKSYKLHLGPLSPTKPGDASHSRCRSTAEVEPGTQLLALFGELVDARMESCLRITQLIRNSNRSMLHS